MTAGARLARMDRDQVSRLLDQVKGDPALSGKLMDAIRTGLSPEAKVESVAKFETAIDSFLEFIEDPEVQATLERAAAPHATPADLSIAGGVEKMRGQAAGMLAITVFLASESDREWIKTLLTP
jgi:hypothetical protein